MDTGIWSDNIKCTVRCGGCCSKREPCESCRLETKLANWHTPEEGIAWKAESATLKAEPVGDKQ